jgi:putative transcriptional regulator
METGGDLNMHIKLRKLRNSTGIPVRELRDVLRLKTDAAYYKKENGKIKFSLEEAKAIADKFNMTIDEVFFGAEVSKMETNISHRKHKLA